MNITSRQVCASSKLELRYAEVKPKLPEKSMPPCAWHLFRLMQTHPIGARVHVLDGLGNVDSLGTISHYWNDGDGYKQPMVMLDNGALWGNSSRLNCVHALEADCGPVNESAEAGDLKQANQSKEHA